MLTQGVWEELSSLEDPELRQLAESLPVTVLAGRAPATVKKYSGAFARWKRWVEAKPGVKAVPAKPIYVALYLNYLIQKSETSTPVQEAVSAISWAHQMATVEDPSIHPFVRNVLAGAKRMLAQPVQKKEPLTVEILENLVDKFGGESANLNSIRSLTISLMGFASFLRFDEISRLKESDVLFFEDHMEIFIESSKTDQLRDGSRLVIACTVQKTCPVKMTRRYLNLAGITSPTDGRKLSRGLTKNYLRSLFGVYFYC